MLVFFGGRERSSEEFLQLFADSGLNTVREVPVGTFGFVAYCLEKARNAVVPASWRRRTP